MDRCQKYHAWWSERSQIANQYEHTIPRKRNLRISRWMGVVNGWLRLWWDWESRSGLCAVETCSPPIRCGYGFHRVVPANSTIRAITTGNMYFSQKLITSGCCWDLKQSSKRRECYRWSLNFREGKITQKVVSVEREGAGDFPQRMAGLVYTAGVFCLFLFLCLLLFFVVFCLFLVLGFFWDRVSFLCVALAIMELTL